MTLALFAVFAAVAIGVFARTLAMTVDAYPRLPQEVPDHFDLYGYANSSGPKPMIFMMVIAQAIAVAVLVIVGVATLLAGAVPVAIVAVGFAIDGISIALMRVQQGILEVALGETERLEQQWIPLAIILGSTAIAVTIAFISGR